jgi:choline dehydrogenase-like flavoprotein
LTALSVSRGADGLWSAGCVIASRLSERPDLRVLLIEQGPPNTSWTVRIPAMDAELEVVPSPREQEFVSQVPALNKYEGASTMAGTWRGKPARGFGYVELVGVWR